MPDPPLAPQRPNPELVKHVRALMDRMDRAARSSNDELEEASDAATAAIVDLAQPGLVGAIRVAAGASSRRREHAAHLLSALTDDPDALGLMASWIRDPNDAIRSAIIQTIGVSELRSFAPLLAERIEHDPDPFCQDMAIHAAGALRAPECLPAILRLADGGYRGAWRLAQTLASYGTEACRPYLLGWFDDGSRPHAIRLQAAWGLGKLGNRRAIDYLIDELDADGEAVDRLRCAQALCDIHGWEWEWHIDYIGKTAERIRQTYRP